MGFMGGIIGGVLAGVIGAVIWAFIAYYANVEIGWIAWIIGGLVGVGVAIGCRGETGTETGALAAIIALVSICGGKFAAIHMDAQAVSTTMAASVRLSDEDAKLYMAGQLVTEYEGAGKTLTWPKDMTADAAETPADYPKDLWKDVETRWAAMGGADQASYRARIEARMKADLREMVHGMANADYKSTFGFLDVVFFLLALVTAFKVGGGMAGGD